MKILYTSDLHGKTSLYQQVLDLACSSSIEAIILGGDLLPTSRQSGGYEEMFFHQIKFTAEFLLPLFEECLTTTPVRKIFLIAGNWDMGYPRIFQQTLEGVIDLNEASFSLGDGYELIGYPFVPPTPFRPKDYEKMDDPETPWPPQKNPSYIRTDERPYRVISIDPYPFLKSRGTILEDLQRLPRPQNPRKAIYVMHSPPFGTPLDLIQGGNHVGSRSIRIFLEEQQPLLALHGHIHEAPDISGTYLDRIGRTLCVNPGQSLSEGTRCSRLHAVVFQLEDVEKTLRHSCLS